REGILWESCAPSHSRWLLTAAIEREVKFDGVKFRGVIGEVFGRLHAHGVKCGFPTRCRKCGRSYPKVFHAHGFYTETASDTLPRHVHPEKVTRLYQSAARRIGYRSRKTFVSERMQPMWDGFLRRSEADSLPRMHGEEEKAGLLIALSQAR